MKTFAKLTLLAAVAINTASISAKTPCTYAQKAVAATTLASIAGVAAGVYNGNESLTALSVGGLTGSVCAALENHNVSPALTWVGEIAARYGLVRGFVEAQARGLRNDDRTSRVDFAARGGSWIAYLAYQLGNALDKKAVNACQDCCHDEQAVTEEAAA